MPLERANLPLEGVFRGGDDILVGLGYKRAKIGDKGVIYEKFIGHDLTGKSNDLVADFRVIKIEQSDDGDYIFMGCKGNGLACSGGHQAIWLSFDEVEAAYKLMKKYRRKAGKRMKKLKGG